jgi:hypothetical protein
LPSTISFVFDLGGAEGIKHALGNLKIGNSNTLKNLLQSSGVIDLDFEVTVTHDMNLTLAM